VVLGFAECLFVGEFVGYVGIYFYIINLLWDLGKYFLREILSFWKKIIVILSFIMDVIV
jgi:hypothetical protein